MSKSIIAFDLDDVLCKRPKQFENLGKYKYTYCEPIYENIANVNELFDSGEYEIVIYTARGMKQFDGNIIKIYTELYHLTKEQLLNWGVKHHSLVMGKMHYDVMIDDKAINSSNWIKDLAYWKF